MAEPPTVTERYILQWLVGGGRAATKQAVFEYYERRGLRGAAGAFKVSRRGVATRMYNGLVEKGLIDPDADGVTLEGRRATNG